MVRRVGFLFGVDLEVFRVVYSLGRVYGGWDLGCMSLDIDFIIIYSFFSFKKLFNYFWILFFLIIKLGGKLWYFFY